MVPKAPKLLVQPSNSRGCIFVGLYLCCRLTKRRCHPKIRLGWASAWQTFLSFGKITTKVRHPQFDCHTSNFGTLGSAACDNIKTCFCMTTVKSVSSQKRLGWAGASQAFFWWDSDKDLHSEWDAVHMLAMLLRHWSPRGFPSQLRARPAGLSYDDWPCLW